MAAVQRVAEEVDHSPEMLRTDRHLQRRAGVDDRQAAMEAARVIEADGAEMPLIEMLMNLEKICTAIQLAAQGLPQGRQPLAGDSHHRSLDLGDAADHVCLYLFHDLT